LIFTILEVLRLSVTQKFNEDVIERGNLRYMELETPIMADVDSFSSTGLKLQSIHCDVNLCRK